MFYFHFETVAQRTHGIESFGTTKENNKVNVPTALRFKPINKLQNPVTWRLPDSGVGDGRWWREGGGRGSPTATLVAA